MPNYGPKLFAGTAKFYAKFRAKYPAAMFNDIVSIFGLDGHGSMLDLGTGTGELAMPLAKYFDNVLGLDPDPEMIEQAKLNSKRAKLNNIDWQIASSNDLTEVNRSFKLITLGQSLHWMDEITVIDQLYELLEPSGGLFIVGGGGVSIFSQKNPNVQSKDAAIKRLVTKYLGPERRAGNSTYQPSDLNWEQNLFPNSKFGGFKKRVYKTKTVRTINQELGNLYSMSWARPEFFGSRINEFEAEFRHELSAIDGRGKFDNEVIFEAYFLVK